MRRRQILLRAAAERDIDKATDHYLVEAPRGVADRWVQSLEGTLGWLSTQPEAGSTRWGTELAIEGLRHVAVVGFPYLLFYVVDEETVDVWRVLHDRRDLGQELAT